jgi:hypothetical protein
MNDGDIKKQSIRGLARCYQETQSYRIAVRCYKKLLETAWDTCDSEAEIQAYDGLALQYFYLGQVQKTAYYQDRAARGKLEKRDSKVRYMYMQHLARKRNLKKRN